MTVVDINSSLPLPFFSSAPQLVGLQFFTSQDYWRLAGSLLTRSKVDCFHYWEGLRKPWRSRMLSIVWVHSDVTVQVSATPSFPASVRSHERPASIVILQSAYRALSCTMHTHAFGPNFQEKNTLFLFFNSIFNLFVFRNKTNDHIPGYYCAYGYCYCLLELHF